MATNTAVVNLAIQTYIESLWPSVCPFKIINLEDNVSDQTHLSALVVCWIGTTDNAVTKKVYKVWWSGGTLQRAEIAKTEWPAGI